MLAQELAEYGIAVDAYPDGVSLLSNPDSVGDAELIILDWSLPRSSGIEILGQIRRRGINLPVVILTGRPLVANEMLAFDRGAVEFIDKARGIPILIRRLQNIFAGRKPSTPPAPVLTDGDLTMKLKVSRAFWKGEDVDLTIGEFRIVHFLVSRAGQHMSYREIYDCMRSPGFCAGYGDDGFRTNVRSSIKRIRNKFLTRDPGFNQIDNYAGFGYIWRAGV
jgi:two-component system response regulator ChvI